MESLPSAAPDLPAATTYSKLSSPTTAKLAAKPVSGIESGVRTPQHPNDVGQHVIRPRTQRDRIRRARNKQTHAYGVSLLEGDHEGPASPGDRTGVRCGARPGPRRHAEIRGGDKRQVERIDDADHLPRRAGLLERVAAAGREGKRQEGESSHREAVSTRHNIRATPTPPLCLRAMRPGRYRDGAAQRAAPPRPRRAARDG